MKTDHKKNLTQSRAGLDSREDSGFVATVLFISLLAIMMLLATAGGMALIHFHDEVKVLERQQINRLDTSVTNSVAISHISVTRVDVK
jgi:hypothetical protein